MGYLICDECKGYYELLPGEKPEDFTNICHCGSELRYTEFIDFSGEDKDVKDYKNPITCETELKEAEYKIKSFLCPDCNFEINVKTKSCPHCGYELTQISNGSFKMTFLGLIILILFSGVFIFILGITDSNFGKNLILTLTLWIIISFILIFQYWVNRTE